MAEYLSALLRDAPETPSLPDAWTRLRARLKRARIPVGASKVTPLEAEEDATYNRVQLWMDILEYTPQLFEDDEPASSSAPPQAPETGDAT